MQPDKRTTEEVNDRTFLKRLRESTAAGHEALERHPLSRAISGPAVSREDYVRYLQVMQRVTAGMEGALFPLLDTLIPDLALRRKQSLLSGDLRDLAATDNPFPPFRLVQGAPSAAFALGAFYVLEGSSLGGRVILKQLSPHLGVSPQQGARYFAGYGEETGKHWQRFMALLSSRAEDERETAEIIDGAQHAFLRIADYFNLCLAYEVEGHCQS